MVTHYFQYKFAIYLVQNVNNHWFVMLLRQAKTRQERNKLFGNEREMTEKFKLWKQRKAAR
jgi:hypothetical protein